MIEIGLCSDSTYVIGYSEEYNVLLKRFLNNYYMERLYRRYVKKEDIISTRAKIVDSYKELTKKEQPFFDKLLEAFDYRTKTAEYCLEDYGKYCPLRIVCTDTVYLMLEKNIPLEDYDNLEGDPFWMRPEYVLEKYGQC